MLRKGLFPKIIPNNVFDNTIIFLLNKQIWYTIFWRKIILPRTIIFFNINNECSFHKILRQIRFSSNKISLSIQTYINKGCILHKIYSFPLLQNILLSQNSLFSPLNIYIFFLFLPLMQNIHPWNVYHNIKVKKLCSSPDSIFIRTGAVFINDYFEQEQMENNNKSCHTQPEY